MCPSLVNTHPSYRIASIPADGIGPEVIEAGITALKKLAETLKTFDLEFTNFDWSSDTYRKTGKYMPDNGLETLRKFDAILFGAVGAPSMYTTVLGKIQPVNESAQTSPITSLSGSCVSQSVSHCSSMPTFDQ